MSRFGNFRNRMQSGYGRIKQYSRSGYQRTRKAYSSKTLGMKNSTIVKLAILGALGFMFKDKIKPFINSILNKK